MPVAFDAEENRASAVVPPVQPAAPWRVISVAALSGYRLRVRFVDGVDGFVDMRALVWSSKAGVFETLRDPAVFAGVGVVHGAVTWPNGLDLAPDAMHDEIRTSGEWVLR